MTGMDILTHRISERYSLSLGNARQMVNSNAASHIIETLANEAGLLDEVVKMNLESRERHCRESANWVQEEKEKIRQEKIKNEDEKFRLGNEKIELEKKRRELEQLEAKLKTCETPEARDRMRLYEIFKSDVELETPQNNSVYIAGLASILIGQPVWKFTDANMKID